MRHRVLCSLIMKTMLVQRRGCVQGIPESSDGIAMHGSQPSGLLAIRAHLLVVDTQTWGSFMRANVSLGPPRQAAQLGAAGVMQPAASKIWAAVLPSQPATGKPYRSAHTCMYMEVSALMQGAVKLHKERLAI